MPGCVRLGYVRTRFVRLIKFGLVRLGQVTLGYVRTRFGRLVTFGWVGLG